MAVKKKQLPQESEQQAPSGESMVDFLNGVSWAGEGFSFIPGDVIQLPESIALARHEAGLGEIA